LVISKKIKIPRFLIKIYKISRKNETPSCKKGKFLQKRKIKHQEQEKHP
jgi:hypothetical protein